MPNTGCGAHRFFAASSRCARIKLNRARSDCASSVLPCAPVSEATNSLFLFLACSVNFQCLSRSRCCSIASLHQTSAAVPHCVKQQPASAPLAPRQLHGGRVPVRQLRHAHRGPPRRRVGVGGLDESVDGRRGFLGLRARARRARANVAVAVLAVAILLVRLLRWLGASSESEGRTPRCLRSPASSSPPPPRQGPC